MENLLANQDQIFAAIRQLLSNFKKDGVERKTPAHIKKRLSTLDAYWQDFQYNHIKLCEYEDKSHEYFVKNIFLQTSDFYNETRTFIMRSLPAESTDQTSGIRPAVLGSQPSTSQQQPSEGETAPRRGTWTTQGTSSKLEEMLRKQKSNFKAFQRTTSSLSLDSMSERWECLKMR